MTDFDFRSVYNRVVPIVEKKYGVEVVISDVVDPNTGDSPCSGTPPRPIATWA